MFDSSDSSYDGLDGGDFPPAQAEEVPSLPLDLKRCTSPSLFIKAEVSGFKGDLAEDAEAFKVGCRCTTPGDQYDSPRLLPRPFLLLVCTSMQLCVEFRGCPSGVQTWGVVPPLKNAQRCQGGGQRIAVIVQVFPSRTSEGNWESFGGYWTPCSSPFGLWNKIKSWVCFRWLSHSSVAILFHQRWWKSS